MFYLNKSIKKYQNYINYFIFLQSKVKIKKSIGEFLQKVTPLFLESFNLFSNEKSHEIVHDFLVIRMLIFIEK